MYSKPNIKNILQNLKILLWVLPLCTIAIMLGHAGIDLFLVKFINTSLQKHNEKIIKHPQEIKKDTCLNT